MTLFRHHLKLMLGVFVLAMALASATLADVKILAGDGASDDSFGQSVGIYGDTIVVGSIADLTPEGQNEGAAYVFTRDGDNWNQEARLTASDASSYDVFGLSAAVYGDTAIVGAPSADLSPEKTQDEGAAYIFVRNAMTWTQQVKLQAADASSGDEFGTSVDIDGDTAVVGAWRDDANGNLSGSAYIFVRNGDQWTEQKKLIASDGGPSENFGEMVAIDGDTVIIGSETNDSVDFSEGAAYVFVRTGATWSQQAKLVASDAASFDSFGNAVDVSGDWAIVGAIGDDDLGSYSGSVYFFKRSGTVWTEEAKLNASDGEEMDQLGWSVAIDGDRAIAGARFDADVGSFEQLGSVYYFLRESGGWAEQAIVRASDGSDSFMPEFGFSTAMEGDYAVVGAWKDDELANNAGAAYVFPSAVPEPAGMLAAVAVLISLGGLRRGRTRAA